MLKKSDYYYHLPEELIAQTPATPRDSAKLLCYNRKTKEIKHCIFHDCLTFLKAGDLLVINTTKVLPARLFAKTIHGGKVEILLLKRINLTQWEVLVKSGKKAQVGAKLMLEEDVVATVLAKTEVGGRIIEFTYNGVFEEILERIGHMPLPPYIHEKLQDKDRYQTVYCKQEGSAAAPTAGLHFTTQLIEQLKAKGIEFAEVQLNVGLGTFRPVKEEDLTNHKMHSEYFAIDSKNADRINRAKKEGRRVIAVGTTTVRTLESVADANGFVEECCGDTDIFIYPPYTFKCVDALFTNFHLPESTLLMLVSAFMGREKALELYQLAVQDNYRFFSFGDAMFIE